MKTRIRLTDEEQGVIHRLMIFGHEHKNVPNLTDGSTEQQKKDWMILSKLQHRAAGTECWCGDSCTCGG